MTTLSGTKLTEDGRTYALVITKLGRAAIGVADESKVAEASMDAVKGIGPNPLSLHGDSLIVSSWRAI